MSDNYPSSYQGLGNSSALDAARPQAAVSSPSISAVSQNQHQQIALARTPTDSVAAPSGPSSALQASWAQTYGSSLAGVPASIIPDDVVQARAEAQAAVRRAPIAPYPGSGLLPTNPNTQAHLAKGSLGGTPAASKNDVLPIPAPGVQLPSREQMQLFDITSELIHPNDVLCGRGGATNNHRGNEKFRELVNSLKLRYLESSKRDKPFVSRGIVRAIRAQNPPGRFLQKNEETGLWYDIGDQKAREKTSQALREGAPEIRREITGREAGLVQSQSLGGRQVDAASHPALALSAATTTPGALGTIASIAPSRLSTSAVNSISCASPFANPFSLQQTAETMAIEAIQHRQQQEHQKAFEQMAKFKTAEQMAEHMAMAAIQQRQQQEKAAEEIAKLQVMRSVAGGAASTGAAAVAQRLGYPGSVSAAVAAAAAHGTTPAGLLPPSFTTPCPASLAAAAQAMKTSRYAPTVPIAGASREKSIEIPTSANQQNPQTTSTPRSSNVAIAPKPSKQQGVGGAAGLMAVQMQMKMNTVERVARSIMDGSSMRRPDSVTTTRTPPPNVKGPGGMVPKSSGVKTSVDPMTDCDNKGPSSGADKRSANSTLSLEAEKRLALAETVARKTASGTISSALLAEEYRVGLYLDAGLLGIKPSEIEEELSNGGTEESLVNKCYKRLKADVGTTPDGKITAGFIIDRFAKRPKICDGSSDGIGLIASSRNFTPLSYKAIKEAVAAIGG